MTTIKGVSFDLWFTIIWSDDKILDEYTRNRVEALYRVLSKYGSKASYEDIEKIYEYTAHFRMVIHPKKLVKYIVYAAGLEPTEEIIDEAWRAYEESTYDMKPIVNEEAYETLDKLIEDGYILGVISNTSFSRENIYRILDNIRLKKYFKVIISSASEEVKKPFPEIFIKFLEKAGLKAYEAVHVGDKYIDDVIGAYYVGMQGILYRGLWDKYKVYREFRGEKLLDTCPRECYIVDSLRSVPKVISEISRLKCI